MSFYFTSILFPVVILAMVPAAPDPHPLQKHSFYYPTQLGARAVYTWNGDGDLVVTVTAVEVKMKQTIVNIEIIAHKEIIVSGRMAVTEDNLTWLETDKEFDVDKTHPVCFLKCLSQPGHQWMVKYPSGTKSYKFTTREPEKVKVPAGDFECLRVESEYSGRPESRHTMLWYAPRVGLVKEAVKGETGSWNDSTVLKSYTPGTN